MSKKSNKNFPVYLSIVLVMHILSYDKSLLSYFKWWLYNFPLDNFSFKSDNYMFIKYVCQVYIV